MHEHKTRWAQAELKREVYRIMAISLRAEIDNGSEWLVSKAAELKLTDDDVSYVIDCVSREFLRRSSARAVRER